MVPGVGIGLLGGLVAGALAAFGGLSPAMTLVAGVSLALPLAISGAIYETLLGKGKIPLGNLGPAALFWIVAWPISRAFNALVVDTATGTGTSIRYGWLDFMAYNMLLSVGFAMGFWYFHQTYAHRWYFRIREHNPLAAYMINHQLAFMGWQVQQRKTERAERKAKRAAKRQSRKNR